MGKPNEEGKDCSLEDQDQLMESNETSLNDVVESAKAGMQVDQVGDVLLPLC